MGVGGRYAPNAGRERTSAGRVAARRAGPGHAREEASTLASEDRARNEAACEWADDNDLCSQFEQFCDQFGWQGRVDDVEATVEVTVQVSVLVSDVPRMSRTPTVVEQRIDDDSVRERLREGNFSLRSTSISDRDRTNIASRGVLL